MISFLSDNADGVCKEVLEEIEKVNSKLFSIPYGEDEYTLNVEEEINKKFFEGNAKIFFVYNGTYANVLGINSFLKDYNSVLCLDNAHLNQDENGALERVSGCKIEGIDAGNKLTVSKLLTRKNSISIHGTKTAVISITQSGENGLVYSNSEVKEIAEYAHKNNLVLHMDGARLSNAIAALGGSDPVKSFKENVLNSGVDVISFGMTKNGAMFGDLIAIINRSKNHQEAAFNLKYSIKQRGQLLSKFRFLSAQAKAMFLSDLWIKNATRANLLAQKIYENLKNHVEFENKTDTNILFMKIDEIPLKKIKETFLLHESPLEDGRKKIRIVTSFMTKEESVDSFIKEVKEAVK